jgi:hypothetical protein
MKKKNSRKYRIKPNSSLSLRRVRNPEPKNIEDIVQNETKKYILDHLEAIEKHYNESEFVIEYATMSLLRRQFARGDIDRETLFYWLKTEGLV